MDKEKNPQQQGGSGTEQQKPGQTPAPVWEQPEKDKSGQQGGQKPGQAGGGSQPGGGQKSGTGQPGGGPGGGQSR